MDKVTLAACSVVGVLSLIGGQYGEAMMAFCAAVQTLRLLDFKVLT